MMMMIILNHINTNYINTILSLLLSSFIGFYFLQYAVIHIPYFLTLNPYFFIILLLLIT